MEPAASSKFTGNRDLTNNPAFLQRPKSTVRSMGRIWAKAALTGAVVFLLALGLQWVIYDRLLHEDGLRFVGSVISAGFATLLVYTMAFQERKSQLAELRRLETIALMNHHIRNALQEIVNWAGTSEHATTIRNSVDRIEWVLSDVAPSVSDEEDKGRRQ